MKKKGNPESGRAEEDPLFYDEDEDEAPREERKIPPEQRAAEVMLEPFLSNFKRLANNDDPATAGFRIKAMMNGTFRELHGEAVYKCASMTKKKKPMPKKFEEELECLRKIWKLVQSAKDLLQRFDQICSKPIDNEANVLRARVGLGDWVKKANDQCDRLMRLLGLEDVDGNEVTEDADGNIVDPFSDGLLVMTFRELIDYADDICLDALDTKKPLDPKWQDVFNFLVIVWELINNMIDKIKEHSDSFMTPD